MRVAFNETSLLKNCVMKAKPLRLFCIYFLIILYLIDGFKCFDNEFSSIEREISNAKPCVDFSIQNFQRRVEKTGFHRLLYTQIELSHHSNKLNQNIQIILREPLSEDFFVDKYEVEELFKYSFNLFYKLINQLVYL